MNQEVKETDIVSVVEKPSKNMAHGADAVIPVLSEVNRAFGYIPAEALPEIRRHIHEPEEGVFLADSHLYSVASFYQMFSLRPAGQARGAFL